MENVAAARILVMPDSNNNVHFYADSPTSNDKAKFEFKKFQ